MYINSVNNINLTSSKNKISKNPLFTSIVPVKVFVNGEKSQDIKIIRRVIRAFIKMLQDDKMNDDKTRAFRGFFSKNDPDFRMSIPIRNAITSDISYLFTGGHSIQLNNLGRKIGPAKSNSFKIFGTTQNAEAKSKVQAYFEKIKSFIKNNHSARIKSQGHEIGLHIYTTTTKIPKKRTSQLNIDRMTVNRVIKDI
jgi:hypothetical protein